jgi:hypothetical protein
MIHPTTDLLNHSSPESTSSQFNGIVQTSGQKCPHRVYILISGIISQKDYNLVWKFQLTALVTTRGEILRRRSRMDDRIRQKYVAIA